MLEVPIPKEVNKYEAKLVAGLTTRQTICLVIAAVQAIIVHNILDFVGLSSDISLVLAGVLAVPFLAAGWFKPYGMPFEEFAKIWFRYCYLAPSKRKYIIKNATELYFKQLEEETTTTKKQKKQKYKKSKEAYK